MQSVFYILYYLCALFYVGSGLLLWFKPAWIHDHIPKLFPFLGHFKMERMANAWNLILMGIFLFVVGFLMNGLNYAGFFLALMVSLWEVYLSIAFYHFHMKDMPQAIIHFVVHIAFAVLLGYFILNHF